MNRTLLITAVLLFIHCKSYCQTKDTFEVYFAFNSPKISKESEERIDRLIFKDTLIHGDRLIILGYADYVGGNGHNDTLSRVRAGRVMDYLVKYGFDKKDITLCTGKGKIARANAVGKDGYAPDRKVQIIIDRSAPAAPPAVVAVAPEKPKQNKDIRKTKVNETYALDNIVFEPNLPIFLPQSYDDLEKLLNFMKENPSVRIQIEGHICCLQDTILHDSKYLNGLLSEQRAIAVYKHLVSNGIDKARMRSVGLGNRKPAVYPEVTEDDRIRNRRVEVRILSK